MQEIGDVLAVDTRRSFFVVTFYSSESARKAVREKEINGRYGRFVISSLD